MNIHFIKPLGDFYYTVAFNYSFPNYIFTTILLFLANYGKVFFFQQRPGLNNKVFKIVKFKTSRYYLTSRMETYQS